MRRYGHAGAVQQGGVVGYAPTPSCLPSGSTNTVCAVDAAARAATLQRCYAPIHGCCAAGHTHVGEVGLALKGVVRDAPTTSCLPASQHQHPAPCAVVAAARAATLQRCYAPVSACETQDVGFTAVGTARTVSDAICDARACCVAPPPSPSPPPPATCCVSSSRRMHTPGLMTRGDTPCLPCRDHTQHARAQPGASQQGRRWSAARCVSG